MFRQFTLLILILSPMHLHAQALKGVVTDAETNTALYPAVITNIRTAQTVYTNEKGEFSIVAQTGDKIAFYFIGYKTQQWLMPPAMGTVVQAFSLKPLSYQLSEITVRPGKLTPYQMDSLERHSVYQRALAREHGGSIMSPVTFLAEKLSKNSKQVFNFQKQYNYWETQKFIDSRYTSELVEQLTNLSGDTLAYFMNAYPMPYDYARAATDLEIKMWIRNNFKQWARMPDTARMQKQ